MIIKPLSTQETEDLIMDHILQRKVNSQRNKCCTYLLRLMTMRSIHIHNKKRYLARCDIRVHNKTLLVTRKTRDNRGN